MAQRAVTISTDGLRDYVQTPDGAKYILGATSVLQLVRKLVPSRYVRRVLDEFNEHGAVMVNIDLDQFFEMLTPKRRRFLASPLIRGQDRATTTKGIRAMAAADADKDVKKAIESQIDEIDRQIDVLNQKAKDADGQPAADMKAEVARLQDLIAWLKRPAPYGNQSDNSDTYGLKPVTPGGVKAASFVVFASNSALAEDILGKVAETTETITKLVDEGRKFNAAKARADLHEVTARVAEILESVDIAQPWVSNDLNSLAERATEIHGLFASRAPDGSTRGDAGK